MKIYMVTCFFISFLADLRAQEFVEAVVGLTAELPCNVTAEKPDDKLSVLAWYKNGSTTALYSSRDLRDDHEGGGSSEDPRYRTRDTGPTVQILIIDGVRSSDAGVYHCRADFAGSPAQHTHVQLDVIEPPQRLWVGQLNGSRIATANAGSDASETIGPYYIGDSVSLFCVSFGGKPQPSISWWIDGTPVKETSTPLSQHRVRSNLAYGPLKREDHGKVLSCFASNNDMTQPLKIDVTIDMILPPELVSVTGLARTRAGEALALQCRALGARPPPAIVWRLDEALLYNLEQNVTVESSQHLVTSGVQLTAGRELDEARVACCAVTRTRRGDAYHCAEPLHLFVLYPPLVELKPEGDLVNGTLEVLRGSCLRMNCSTAANPAVFEITWYHKDEEILVRKVEEGSVIDQTLEINSVNESDAGAYRCTATNNEGSARSEIVTVDVVFPPFCVDESIAEYGIGKDEAMNLTCNVRAAPAPNSYRWLIVGAAVNASALRSELPCDSRLTDVNVLSYVRPNDTAVSTIFCWGINSVVGEPVGAPCTSWVTDETAPRPPGSCAARRSANDINVACQPGHDGGMPQKFTLTLISTDTEEQMMSITSLEPKFIVQQPAQENFKFHIVATNKKGNSLVVEINSEDIETEPEDIIQVSNMVADITTLALALCGGVALVALAACGLVLCAHAAPAAPPPLTAYTEESNCNSCQNSDSEVEHQLRRSDSFRRAVARPPRRPAPAPRRSGSFHAPRCLRDEEDLYCNEPIRHTQTCRVHSMQNISRKRELDALCDHLATQLPPEPSYNVPRPINTFYTMPRKLHNRSREISDEVSEAQNSDGFSLPPPPDEITYRPGSRLKDFPTKTIPTYSTIARKDSRNNPSKMFNNVIISPMNTVGLPTTSAAQGGPYSYPDDHQVNNHNPFDSPE